MKKLVRWLVLLLLLAGLAFVFVAVPLGGKTALDRLTGESGEPSRAKSVDAGVAPKTASDNHGLTDEDRRGLDRLIDSKLKEHREGEM